MPDRVHLVWAGLLEQSLEVVGMRSRLTFVAVRSSHDVPYIRVARPKDVACASSCHPQCPPWRFGWRRRTAPPYHSLVSAPCLLGGR
jgi:hypothetical protein